MKKLTALILSLILLLTAAAAFGDGAATPAVPKYVSEYGTVAEYNTDGFAKLKTKREGGITTVTLDKPVEQLQANWMGYGEGPEDLTVTDLTAQVSHAGHKYQLGAIWTNGFWEPFLWEDDHDIYFDFNDSKATIEAGIEAVRKYVNSDAFGKTAEAQEFKSWVQEVRGDVAVEMPTWSIYTIEKGADGTLKKSVLKSFDYGTDKAVIEKEYAAMVAANPDLMLYEGSEDGHAWGELTGRDYFSSEGAPDYAYITKQGDYKVVYGRSGKVKYFEKTVENVDLFGVGAGTATFTYAQNNGGVWYPRKVTLELPSGAYKTITAKYNGNGKLYGIGLNNAE